MPNFKSHNQRNTSRKSTQSSASETSQVNEDDFGTLSLLTKKKTSMSRNTTPTNKMEDTLIPIVVSERPDFMEPLSPKPITPPPAPAPWETLQMTESDYIAMMQRVYKQQYEDMRQTYIDNVLAELKTPRYWLDRIEILEKEREYFNKKRAWSAGDIMAVERIDGEIKECENELDALYGDEDRLENEYD